MTSILIPIGSMFIAVCVGIFFILHRLQKLDEHISRVESAVSHIELSTKHFQASFDYLLQERGMMAKWDWHPTGTSFRACAVDAALVVVGSVSDAQLANTSST